MQYKRILIAAVSITAIVAGLTIPAGTNNSPSEQGFSSKKGTGNGNAYGRNKTNTDPTPTPTPTPTPDPTTPPPDPTPTPPPPTGGTATGRFYVVGKDIVDPSGNKFFPIGVNMGINLTNYPQWAFTQFGTGNGHSADAQRWGFNIVRVQVFCHNNADGTLTIAQSVARVNAVIDEYTAKKIVVMPDCHDTTGHDQAHNDGVYSGINQFWTAIATRNKGNPYVWANYVNEPFTGSAASSDWTAVMVQGRNLIRSIDPEMIFVADMPGWGQGADEMANTSYGTNLVSGQCNVILSWHDYGALGDVTYQTQIARNLQAKNLAVIFGEYGYDWQGYRSDSGGYAWNKRGADFIFDVAPSLGMGGTWWHGTGAMGGDDWYSLIQGGNQAFYAYGTVGGVTLSGAGQRMWNLAHNKPNLGAFTGSLAASNCPSAQGL